MSFGCFLYDLNFNIYVTYSSIDGAYVHKLSSPDRNLILLKDFTFSVSIRYNNNNNFWHFCAKGFLVSKGGRSELRIFCHHPPTAGLCPKTHHCDFRLSLFRNSTHYRAVYAKGITLIPYRKVEKSSKSCLSFKTTPLIQNNNLKKLGLFLTI